MQLTTIIAVMASKEMSFNFRMIRLFNVCEAKVKGREGNINFFR
jgi:hypothetical protein